MGWHTLYVLLKLQLLAKAEALLTCTLRTAGSSRHVEWEVGAAGSETPAERSSARSGVVLAGAERTAAQCWGLASLLSAKGILPTKLL